MRFALATAYTVVGLAHARHGTVETNQVFTAQLEVFVIHFLAWQRAVVLAFVVMYEDGRDIDAIGTRHAVLAVVAGNVL